MSDSLSSGLPLVLCKFCAKSGELKPAQSARDKTLAVLVETASGGENGGQGSSWDIVDLRGVLPGLAPAALPPLPLPLPLQPSLLASFFPPSVRPHHTIEKGLLQRC